MHFRSYIPSTSLLLHAALFSTPYFVNAAPSPPAGNASAVSSAWWPSWRSPKFPPNKIDWGLYDIVKFAFVATQADRPHIGFFDNSSDPVSLKSFIEEAHNAGKKGYVSVGGWTGSRFFSSSVQTAENRTAFVADLVDFATTYKVDGFDFDWEFLTKAGIGCNTYAPSDTANFLEFLKELRKTINGTVEISIAAGIAPFPDESGQPMTNVSEFADVINHLTVMNYDVYGNWSTTTGPNAPLDDTCAPESERKGSAVSAIKTWEAAGFPADKILLGVAAYGRGFTVTPQDALDSSNNIKPYTNFSHSNIPAGTGEDPNMVPVKNVCGVIDPITTGIFTFGGLIDSGYLDSSGKPAKGIKYAYDNCSQTPYVYNTTSQVMVSYDNAQSLEAKKGYIASNKLLGFAMWEASGDSPDNILLKAIHG